MSRRVYIGRLPPDVTKRDVDNHFQGYGSIVDCRIMGGFGFLEFGSSRDAEDVCRTFNNRPFMNAGDIIVEPAKESGRRRDTYESAPPRSNARGGRGIRVLVKGISADVSWQDLKDFGREGGPVIFADVDRNTPGVGILEYPTMPDAEAAVARLRELDIRGTRPDVVIDDAPPPPPRDMPPRDDSYRRGPPPRDDYYRRDRSPPRRDRSPPRYDDRRGNGYSDRRDRSPPRRDRSPRRDDYRRDRSPRRDDYRRDERDRTTERAPETRAAPLRGERGGDLA